MLVLFIFLFLFFNLLGVVYVEFYVYKKFSERVIPGFVYIHTLTYLGEKTKPGSGCSSSQNPTHM
jgi:hypothetical protein